MWRMFEDTTKLPSGPAGEIVNFSKDRLTKDAYSLLNKN